jgi:hypothetical protein
VKRYYIKRFFVRENVESVVIKRGLTLKEAQEHVRDPETSSRTAQGKEGLARKEQFGDWFDGYEEEP